MWKKLTIFTLTINLLLTAAGCVTAADKKKAPKEESFDTYEMLVIILQYSIVTNDKTNERNDKTKF